jgi:xanthine/CO dehydrogenase XdhC/CoxF family maturation factor
LLKLPQACRRLDRHPIFPALHIKAMEKECAMIDAEDVLSVAAGWLEEGEHVALATVVKTWGSSPRPAGSQMAVTLSGRMAGSVSGGCIEGAVAQAALAALASGAPTTLSFGVTNERAWEVGLACGGQVDVFVEPLAARRP